MVLCACFWPSATRYDNETEAPQIVTRLDVAKQAPDAAPASSPAARGAGKAAVDQSSARDTYTAADKAASAKTAAASPKPVLDAQTSIWEKLASHEIRNLSPTPEPREVTPGPEAQAAAEEARKTPDLTITGTSIRPVSGATPAAAAAGVKPVSAKKPWGARSAPSSGGADPTTPPSSRRASSSSGGARRSVPGASPAAAGVPSSLLKPTAASAARAQATSKPKGDEAVWKC